MSDKETDIFLTDKELSGFRVNSNIFNKDEEVLFYVLHYYSDEEAVTTLSLYRILQLYCFCKHGLFFDRENEINIQDEIVNLLQNGSFTKMLFEKKSTSEEVKARCAKTQKKPASEFISLTPLSFLSITDGNKVKYSIEKSFAKAYLKYNRNYEVFIKSVSR